MHAHDLANYYETPAVRDRIGEFLGGKPPTAAFLIAGDAAQFGKTPRPVSDLSACLQQGMEIARSLWDTDSLIAHLDIEYVNFDFPAQVYLHQERAFFIQAPVIAAVDRLLAASHIQPCTSLVDAAIITRGESSGTRLFSPS
ncbi:MAG: hypothetical protein ABIT76_00395 [Chthoniobacterales bacterium]